MQGQSRWHGWPDGCVIAKQSFVGFILLTVGLLWVNCVVFRMVLRCDSYARLGWSRMGWNEGLAWAATARGTRAVPRFCKALRMPKAVDVHSGSTWEKWGV